MPKGCVNEGDWSRCDPGHCGYYKERRLTPYIRGRLRILYGFGRSDTHTTGAPTTTIEASAYYKGRPVVDQYDPKDFPYPPEEGYEEKAQ
jgi:hypothetical protein